MRKKENGTVQGERGVLDMSADIDLEKLQSLKTSLALMI